MKGTMVRRFGRLVGCVLLLTCLCHGSSVAKDEAKKKGKAEVMVIAVSKKAIVDALANAAIDNDYSVASIQDYKAIFEKDAGILEGALFGSKYDPTAKKRLSFDLLETGEGIRVIASLEMVTNPGSAFERRNDVSKSGKPRNQLQQLLESIKADLESRTPRREGATPDSSGADSTAAPDSAR